MMNNDHIIYLVSSIKYMIVIKGGLVNYLFRKVLM